MNLKIFAGESNPRLAGRIVDSLNTLTQPPAAAISLGDIYHHTFPSGEFHCQYKENIRGADVFLIQSLNSPVNNHLMQLMVMADAARRSSAERITAVIPFMGYARSDRKVQSRTPIAAKLVIDLLQTSGIDRIVTMDLHSGQIQGFTNQPFDNLYFFPLIVEYIKANYDLKNLCIVSPDVGGTKRASALAKLLGCKMAIVIKQRENDTIVTSKGIVGDVKGMRVLIVDDMTESLGTLIEASKSCLEEGATEVSAAVAHGLLTEIGLCRLASNKVLKNLIITNTVSNNNLEQNSLLPLTVLDSSDIFAKAIYSIHTNQSISQLFEIEGF